MLLFVVGVIVVGSLLIVRQSRHATRQRADMKEERPNGASG